MEYADQIFAYENGELGLDETVELFAKLIRNDRIRHLQGSYERTAWDFVKAGFITPAGEVTGVHDDN